jgi:demethylmenaquinone methyltransferase/2-methoxy-6-polyprenyl-1,4-benzoquinol methylase
VADFDPTTVRGRAPVAVEHLVGFDSRFDPPGRVADRFAAVGMDPIVVDEGFGSSSRAPASGKSQGSGR